MDYSNKTNDELNIEVAKRKGWKETERHTWKSPIDGVCYVNPAHWSTSMDASQELMQEMVDAGCYITGQLRKQTSILNLSKIYANEKTFNYWCEPKEEPRFRTIAWLTWKDTRKEEK